jgi:hypothetical protein
MAYAKSYLGDTLASGVVVQTIAAKTAIIPNVTVKGELAGKISANVVEFWYNLAPTVGDATAGADFNLTNVGVKKATLTLERALQIDERMPQIAIETISAPIVADQTAKASVALANALQAKFITDLLALAQAKTYTFGLGLLDAIVEGMATFELASSAKILGVNDTTFSNKTNGIRPTTVVLGPVGKAKLLQDPGFKSLFQGAGDSSYSAILGQVFGLTVVFAHDLTGVDFILLNYEGVAYPYSLNALRVVESEQFVGIRLQAELVYTNATQPGVLVIDSYAMKFTQGADPAA